jgi:hypothetical protein
MPRITALNGLSRHASRMMIFVAAPDSFNGGACTEVTVDGKDHPDFDERGAAFRPFTGDAAIRVTLGARRARD